VPDDRVAAPDHQERASEDRRRDQEVDRRDKELPSVTGARSRRRQRIVEDARQHEPSDAPARKVAWLATCVREKAIHRNGPSAHLRHERSLGMPRIAGASAWLGESAIAPDLCDLVRPLLKVWPVSKPAKIWTVGHSNHPADRFLALLQQHGIETVVDVRSQPYSRFSPTSGSRACGKCCWKSTSATCSGAMDGLFRSLK